MTEYGQKYLLGDGKTVIVVYNSTEQEILDQIATELCNKVNKIIADLEVDALDWKAKERQRTKLDVSHKRKAMMKRRKL